MHHLLLNVLWLMSRYIHVVCATLLVGGTLFYEMVVPLAIDELSSEQQLLVFAKARWTFKWIVWFSAFFIILSGVVNTMMHWEQYTNVRYTQIAVPAKVNVGPEIRTVPRAGQVGLWWSAHVSAGTIAVLIALSLTIGAAPPVRPVRWMQLNLMILLLVMFLATATRQARLQAELGGSPTPPPTAVNGG